MNHKQAIDIVTNNLLSSWIDSLQSNEFSDEIEYNFQEIKAKLNTFLLPYTLDKLEDACWFLSNEKKDQEDKARKKIIKSVRRLVDEEIQRRNNLQLLDAKEIIDTISKNLKKTFENNVVPFIKNWNTPDEYYLSPLVIQNVIFKGSDIEITFRDKYFYKATFYKKSKCNTLEKIIHFDNILDLNTKLNDTTNNIFK